MTPIYAARIRCKQTQYVICANGNHVCALLFIASSATPFAGDAPANQAYLRPPYRINCISNEIGRHLAIATIIIFQGVRAIMCMSTHSVWFSFTFCLSGQLACIGRMSSNSEFRFFFHPSLQCLVALRRSSFDIRTTIESVSFGATEIRWLASASIIDLYEMRARKTCRSVAPTKSKRPSAKQNEFEFIFRKFPLLESSGQRPWKCSAQLSNGKSFVRDLGTKLSMQKFHRLVSDSSAFRSLESLARETIKSAF